MSIQANIKAIKKKILMEVGESNRPISEDLQQKAILAILNGIGTQQWQKYMELFIDAGNTKQLDRLMAADTTKGDKDMDRARAYLVADAPCGTDTVTGFGNAASALLDLGLD